MNSNDQLASGDVNAMADVIRPDEPRDGTARQISPAAKRALEEAEARRKDRAEAAVRSIEIGGRSGPEPTRYGDWEKGGIVSDF